MLVLKTAPSGAYFRFDFLAEEPLVSVTCYYEQEEAKWQLRIGS